MAKLHDEWKVLPHGSLHEVEPGLLTVVGQIPMPLGNFPRRMTIVALPRKRSLIYSPVPLGEAAMKRIEALGVPSILVVPNASHRLDIRPFHKRYPKARIVTAPGARKAVEEAVEIDSTGADLGKSIELVPVAGTDGRELAMLVTHGGGRTLITNDIIGNVANPAGIGARIMARLTGFGPRPAIPRLIRRLLVSNPSALADQLHSWASLDDLCRIIPSHGDIIDRPQRMLERLAKLLTDR